MTPTTEELKEALISGLQEVNKWKSVEIEEFHISGVASFLSGFIVGYLGLDEH